jgi:hypothetical protein
MGGKIWLESTPGQGTTVSFSLRFQKVHNSEVVNREQTSRELDPMAKYSSENNGHEELHGGCIDLSTIPRNELRICIAEDNLINQRIAISFVQKLGFKCDAYPDGYITRYSWTYRCRTVMATKPRSSSVSMKIPLSGTF